MCIAIYTSCPGCTPAAQSNEVMHVMLCSAKKRLNKANEKAGIESPDEFEPCENSTAYGVKEYLYRLTNPHACPGGGGGAASNKPQANTSEPAGPPSSKSKTGPHPVDDGPAHNTRARRAAPQSLQPPPPASSSHHEHHQLLADTTKASPKGLRRSKRLMNAASAEMPPSGNSPRRLPRFMPPVGDPAMEEIEREEALVALTRAVGPIPSEVGEIVNAVPARFADRPIKTPKISRRVATKQPRTQAATSKPSQQDKSTSASAPEIPKEEPKSTRSRKRSAEQPDVKSSKEQKSAKAPAKGGTITTKRVRKTAEKQPRQWIVDQHNNQEAKEDETGDETKKTMEERDGEQDEEKDKRKTPEPLAPTHRSAEVEALRDPRKAAFDRTLFLPAPVSQTSHDPYRGDGEYPTWLRSLKEEEYQQRICPRPAPEANLEPEDTQMEDASLLDPALFSQLDQQGPK